MRNWAKDNRIIEVVGGSRSYGMGTDTSDIDLRSVAMPPVKWLLGFPPDPSSETVEEKTEGRDIVTHVLPKFVRLAMKGNPSILEVLFCRDEDVVMLAESGRQLRSLRRLFLSKLVYGPFSGYAYGCVHRMKNHNTPNGSHREFFERYGFEAKNASHAIRLLHMAKEILKDGEVNVYRPDADFLLSIRNGAMTAEEVEALAKSLDAECKVLLERSSLPDRPDAQAIESWLIETQTKWVGSQSSSSMAGFLRPLSISSEECLI